MKLIDFSSAHMGSNDLLEPTIMETFIGTPGFIAPEVLDREWLWQAHAVQQMAGLREWHKC